ncbi:hypothetical protein WUBG_06857 [Wuchereria bancrofti]|nr:hypothetical protein WUBG_06857 [Wuchereria bancrofti]
MSEQGNFAKKSFYVLVLPQHYMIARLVSDEMWPNIDSRTLSKSKKIYLILLELESSTSLNLSPKLISARLNGSRIDLIDLVFKLKEKTDNGRLESTRNFIEMVPINNKEDLKILGYIVVEATNITFSSDL